MPRIQRLSVRVVCPNESDERSRDGQRTARPTGAVWGSNRLAKGRRIRPTTGVLAILSIMVFSHRREEGIERHFGDAKAEAEAKNFKNHRPDRQKRVARTSTPSVSIIHRCSRLIKNDGNVLLVVRVDN